MWCVLTKRLKDLLSMWRCLVIFERSLKHLVMVGQTLKDVVKHLAGFGQTFQMYFKR
jgi:hypothetical protein